MGHDRYDYYPGTGWHMMELGIRRATSATASDGWFEVAKDGATIVKLGGLPLYTLWPGIYNVSTFGHAPVGGVDTQFAIDLDELVISNRRL
jgi:hypothetical protein